MAIPIHPVILHYFYTDGPLPKFNIILTRKLLLAQDICSHVYDFNDTIGPSLYMFMILLAQAYMFMILSALDICLHVYDFNDYYQL